MSPGDAVGGPGGGQGGAGDAEYAIRPLHVILFGAGSLTSGALVTATLAYKRAAKQLAADGIDPCVRRVILPHALRALVASLFATGCAAGAGFFALRSWGLVASDSAPVPPPREALRLVLWGEVVGGGGGGGGAAQGSLW
ncbi:MAG: hypothetical protein J3K34DRAFT_526853 [Monoraphidium minutum]|nr:MAG: hypothetical protein J3K34DRAFT_526853 [Monoraphidium minutum]